MNARSRLVEQFRKPQGPLGALAGWVMATRPSNKARNRWTVDLLDVQKNDHVLEIGCGPGIALALAASKATEGNVVGIDHSRLMIRHASRRNAATLRNGRLRLHVGGLETLQSLEPGFTKALTTNVAQFFPDKAVAFAKIGSVLAPGALLATTYQPRSKRPTEADSWRMAEVFRDALEAAGFVELRIQTLPLHPVSAVCVLARKSG